MTKPFDLKNDPKYLQRVLLLQSKTFTRVMKDPVLIDFESGEQGYVVAIGLNGSYLVVMPKFKANGREAWGYSDMFILWWSGKKSAAFNEGEVSKWMSMWLITSTDADYDLVKHRDVDPVKICIAAIIKKRGVEYFNNGYPTIHINVQGVTQEIPNPYLTAR